MTFAHDSLVFACPVAECKFIGWWCRYMNHKDNCKWTSKNKETWDLAVLRGYRFSSRWGYLYQEVDWVDFEVVGYWVNEFGWEKWLFHWGW